MTPVAEYPAVTMLERARGADPKSVVGVGDDSVGRGKERPTTDPATEFIRFYRYRDNLVIAANGCQLDRAYRRISARQCWLRTSTRPW